MKRADQDRLREESPETMPGIYVHIPFCLKKCGYCDFFSMPTGGRAVAHAKYFEAIAAQLERELNSRDVSPLADRRISSVYFGGGTPSLMPPEFFAAVLALLRRHFDIAPDAEVSAEINPATADAAWFQGARDAGITRASIGVQSFQPRLLAALGRIHSAEEAMQAIAEAQDAGFKSVGVDLMYAIPEETIAEIENDLRTAMTFQPQHISAYELTIEAGTPMARCHSEPKAKNPLGGRGILRSVQDDIELAQMRTVARMLSRGGWTRYEISNFARPGHECRHNLNYWRYGEWLGLGAGATSFVRDARAIDSPSPCPSPLRGEGMMRGGSSHESRVTSHGFGRRWTQVRDVEKYLAGAPGPSEDEAIDAGTAAGEFCFMGLRTTEGISAASFESLFGEPLDRCRGEICSSLIRDGLLEKREDRFFLTSRGLELANQVFARFVR